MNFAAISPTELNSMTDLYNSGIRKIFFFLLFFYVVFANEFYSDHLDRIELHDRFV